MKGLVTNNQNFGFSIPEEGSLITVLNFAIPVTSKKYELVHKLIDFLWSKRVALENFKAYGYNPANTLAYSEIDDCFFKNPSFFPTEQVFKRLYVAHNQAITVKELAKMWLAIKSM
jgi:putrescine transport system substrate-binding protein